MAMLILAPALSRWLQGDAASAGSELSLAVDASSVEQALQQLFQQHPALRGYILDDHGSVRKHVAIFVDGVSIRDKTRLTEPLRDAREIHIVQALSGG